jgi:hypothetical protein
LAARARNRRRARESNTRAIKNLALRAVNEVVRFPTITRAGPKVAMLQIHTNLASLAAQRHYGIA